MAVDTRIGTEPQTDAALIAELEELYKQAERAQADRERLWRENIAFLEGIQWLRSVERRLLNTAGVGAKGRIRLVDNRMLDHSRRLHARLTQARYMPDVLADTDDPGDRAAAKSGRGWLRWFYRTKQVTAEWRRAAWWIVACGTCYLEPFFDPQAGEARPVPVLDEATGEPVLDDVLDDFGNPVLIEEEITDPATGEPVTRQVPKQVPRMALEPIGDIDFVVRAPFQVKPDPRFVEWRRLRWVFVDEVASHEEVLLRFGDAMPDLAERLKKADRPVQIAPWIPDVPRLAEDETGIPKPLPGVAGAITVRRFYERPSAKHPRGRHVVYVPDANVVLYPRTGEDGERADSGDLDTPGRDFPLEPVCYLDVPWLLGGRSPAGDIKGLQRIYNRILSRYGEHLVRFAAGWLMDPITSGIPRGGFTSEVGGRIRYNPAGGEPKFIFPPFQGLAWYDRFLDRVLVAMEERLQLPPAARGQMPRGARAARTIQLLQEAADAVNEPVLAGISDSLAGFYKKVLALAVRHFTVGRTITLIGPDKIAETMELRGDIFPRNWEDRLTIRVEAGESLPQSKLARMELVLTLARQHGMFGEVGSPEYIRRLRDALELDAGFISSDEDLDITIAEQENLALVHDEAVDARVVDDDAVHLRTHLTFIKRMVATRREGEIRPLMEHVERHQMQLVRKMPRTEKDVVADAEVGGAPGAEPQEAAEAPAPQ